MFWYMIHNYQEASNKSVESQQRKKENERSDGDCHQIGPICGERYCIYDEVIAGSFGGRVLGLGKRKMPPPVSHEPLTIIACMGAEGYFVKTKNLTNLCVCNQLSPTNRFPTVANSNQIRFACITVMNPCNHMLCRLVCSASSFCCRSNFAQLDITFRWIRSKGLSVFRL